MVCGALLCLSTRAATLYVDVASTNAVSPYTNWAIAAAVIQDAVDDAAEGDTVLVTDGVYASGGRASNGLMTNRVMLDKRLTLASVNGPEFTAIQGYHVPVTANGDGAIRCVYLGNGAVLTGFTLMNGATLDWSVNYDEMVGGGAWCESTNVSVANCIITNNSAIEGGGAYGGTLNNCTLSGNWASDYGGGTSQATVNHCLVTGNRAYGSGGGAESGVLNSCTLAGNVAGGGGGAARCTLNNCVVVRNTTSYTGGGVVSCRLYNCTVSDNVSQPPDGICGGAANSTLTNSILYHNSVGTGELNYDDNCTLSYCCTTPLPTSGTGNITNEPAFVNLTDGDFHLRYGSPCIDAGTDLSAIITNDFDGRLRPLDGDGDGIAAFDIGAYECVPLMRYVWQESPNPSPPYTNWATAAQTIQEAVDAAQAGDAVLVVGGVYDTGGRAVVGTMTNRVAIDKPIWVESLMGPEVTVIQGYQLSSNLNGDGAIRCVYLADGATLSGFTLTNGATRTSGDYYLEQSGGGVWCESTNATVTNCILIGNSASDSGGGAETGTLNTCTLTRNWAGIGGGADVSTLNNCTLASNSVSWYGGGAFYSTLNNCTLTGNAAYNNGGGAFAGTLNNCTLTGNSARLGGGVAGIGDNCRLNNCIIYHNTPRNHYILIDMFPVTNFNYCCTTPDPGLGLGNITKEPAFVDLAGGNLRLQSNSPCMDAGNNAYVSGSSDLDGSSRIARLRVDMGAYEYQGAGLSPFIAWLQQYGLPTDGSADFTDPDHDGLNTWQEWMADTDPTNSASCLRLTITSNSPPVAVTFSSSASRLYTLLSSTSLTPSYGWTPIPGQIDIPGSGDALTLSDTNPPWPAFYRVSVRLP